MQPDSALPVFRFSLRGATPPFGLADVDDSRRRWFFASISSLFAMGMPRMPFSLPSTTTTYRVESRRNCIDREAFMVCCCCCYVQSYSRCCEIPFRQPTRIACREGCWVIRNVGCRAVRVTKSGKNQQIYGETDEHGIFYFS
jgi:hypothetical protein